jgi:uroporphyrinogen-III decarboxylase
MSGNIEERKKHWNEFYSGGRRTLTLIEMDYGERVFPTKDNAEIFFNYIVHKSRVQMDCLEWLDDDRVPCISAVMGTENFAHAFGCPVIYPGNNNPFTKPIVFSAADAAKLKKPVLENSTLMQSLEYGKKLRSAASNAVIQVPDIQSPLDIAALIWDKNDFFMALYDEPAAVKDIIFMCYEILIEFFDLWFKEFGREFTAHYPDYYMPYGITVSEDEIGSISTEQFYEFSYPTLCNLSEHFGNRIGIHCCANAKHQWSALKSIPGLVMLNLIQPDDIIKEASAYFCDAACQMFNFNQNDFTDPNARIVLQSTAASKNDAIEKLKVLNEIKEKRDN